MIKHQCSFYAHAHCTCVSAEQCSNMVQFNFLITQFYPEVYLLKYYWDLFSMMMCNSVSRYYVVKELSLDGQSAVIQFNKVTISNGLVIKLKLVQNVSWVKNKFKFGVCFYHIQGFLA